MKTSRTDRRSKRVPAKHQLFLTVPGPGETPVAKEVVLTLELSRHGARVRGRCPLEPGWNGVLAELRSLRKAPFRVAWQAQSLGAKGYLDTGLEFLEDSEFWGETFPKPEAEPIPAAIKDAAISPEKLLQELSKLPVFQAQERGRFLETVWCSLVEQLEERKVFTRAELVACLREIGQL